MRRGWGRSREWRRATRHRNAAGLVALLLAVGVGAPLSGIVPDTPAHAAPADVIAAGRVFADYDGDGVFDDDASDGFVEHGVNGVTVTVTDALGRSATTRSVRQQEFQLGTDGQPGGWIWTSEGDWSMTEGEFTRQTGEVPFVKEGRPTARLRVTFSDAPEGYESWFAGDLRQNATSVRFVPAGDENVDFALSHPDEHRQNPLDVITAIQSAGDPDPSTPNFVDTPALTSADWSTSQAVHSYVDANGNGQHDDGEEFAPTDEDGDEYQYFEDENGDGAYQDGEPLSAVAFDDENGNGQWDSGPWTNATAYSQVTPSDPTTIPAAPVTAASVRVLLPDGQECWAGPFTFTDRLVEDVTVPNDPGTPVDESVSPRPVAYYAGINVNCWNFTGTLRVVFVPGGFWDGEPQYTEFPATEQTTPEAPRTLAMFSEVGALWGAAYERTSNTALFSAVYKRISGLAEHRWGGSTQRALGGIFRITDVLEPGTAKIAGDIGPSGDVEPWFSLADVGIDVGDVPSNADRGLGAATEPVADPDAFAQAAEVGIGAIDTWTDGTTTYLFVMNLADRTLYRIDISGSIDDPGFVPAAGDVTAISLGLGDADRPWAVEVWHDEVHVGWTETGTTPGECATLTDPGGPPSPGNPVPPDPDLPPCDAYQPLNARIASVAVDGGTPETMVEYSLGYPRGNPIGNWGDQGDRYADENPQTRHWNTWTDEWTWDAGDADGDGWPDGSVGIDASAGTAWSSGHHLQVYPQAVLSSMTFDPDGFLTVGMTDRTELQAGNIQWAADAEEAGGTSQEIYFEAVSAGEMLVAGRDEFAEGGPGYVLENAGYTRARFGADGTYTQRWDESVEHHSTGPGGFEFYDDDQALDASARGAGIQNHEEVALGAVLRVPGATDVASTAFDPLVNIRVQGLMWFSEDAGTPVRAVELTDDPGQASTPGASFQKGGGLGDLDALVPPPPIEIGNRVWFDADQDGHQSADEPGIPGLTVELVDAAGQVLGTQTTQADGTYYFSTRDDDPVDHYAPMEYGENYTARFVKPGAGTLAVDLWGMPVTVPWDQVPFTDQQVEPVIARANPHDPDDNADGVNERPQPRPDPEVSPEPVADPDRIDSNPAVDTGEYQFALGGPGQNEHSIDAGFLAYAPLDIVKSFDPGSVPTAPGTTFDLALQATDFRGLSVGVAAPDPDAAYTFDDLAGFDGNAGLVTPADPDGVADGVLTVRVGPDGTVPTSRVWLPIGSTVRVTEVASDDVADVAYTPDGPVLLDDGDPDSPTTVRIVNTMASGNFTVTKAIAGQAVDDVPDGTAFAMEYSLDGGATWLPFTVGYDADDDGTPAPWTSPEVSAGAQVLVREATPLPAPPTGVVWGTPAISGEGVTYDPQTGLASFTVTGNGTSVELTVTNTATPAPGGFEVVKEITGEAAGDVPPATTFPIEYSIDGGETWLPLEVTADGTPVGVGDLPAGTLVQVREGTALPTVPGVVWGTPMLTVGGGEPRPGPVTFIVGPGATVEVVVTNLAEPEPGTFSVRKIVIGGAAGVVGAAAPTFTVEYAVDDGDPGTPLEWIPLGIPWGEVAFPDGDFPPGTTVWIREATPLPDVDGVEWGQPQLFIGTEPVDSPASFEIRPGGDPSPMISLVNTAEAAPGSFTVTKTLQGSAADAVPDGTAFTIEYSIDGGPPVRIEVPFSESVTVPEVPAGATVTISEVGLPDITGVDWGTPVLTLDGVPQSGAPVTFTVAAGSGVAVGVTNTAEEVPGQFSVTKAVAGAYAGEVPEGTEFVLEYSVDGGDTWAALIVPLGTLVTSGDLPAGTRVLVREGSMPEVPGVVFGDPAITGAAVTTDAATGYAFFTVGAGEVVELTMTNQAGPAPGGFRAVKLISGNGAAEVPAVEHFVLEYSTDDGVTWTPLEVGADGVPVVVEDVPAGSVIQLRETDDRPDLPDVEWGDVVISGDGVTYDAETGIATCGVEAGTTVGLTVTNPATLTPGDFTLTKALDGAAAGDVPAGTEFTIEHTVDGGPPARVTLTAGQTWTSEQLPTGATVTITEVDLPELDNVIWGDPVITVDGVSQGPAATFTVGSATTVAIVVTNDAAPSPPPGTPPPPAQEPSPPPDGLLPGQNSPTLPDTGVDEVVLSALRTGVLFLAIGAGLVLFTRRECPATRHLANKKGARRRHPPG